MTVCTGQAKRSPSLSIVSWPTRPWNRSVHTLERKTEPLSVLGMQALEAIKAEKRKTSDYVFKGTVTHDEVEQSRDKHQAKMSSLLSAFKRIKQLQQQEENGLFEDEEDDGDRGQALYPQVLE